MLSISQLALECEANWLTLFFQWRTVHLQPFGAAKLEIREHPAFERMSTAAARMIRSASGSLVGCDRGSSGEIFPAWTLHGLRSICPDLNPAFRRRAWHDLVHDACTKSCQDCAVLQGDDLQVPLACALEMELCPSISNMIPFTSASSAN
jgi:hypothetical protein